MYKYVMCLLYTSLVTIAANGNKTSKLQEVETNSNDYINSNGFGSKWMYFPDGDDIPHPISLEAASPVLARMDRFYDIEYRLYTRHNVYDFILLNQYGQPLNYTKIPLEEMLSTLPIKVVTHGWESSAEKSAVQNLKNAYLKANDVVVIGVNWGDIAYNEFYPLVAYQTMTVGKNIGRFLDALRDRYNVTGQQLHLIGHSLGAHVMGNAGEQTKLQIDRITGLDAARPLFEFLQFPGISKLDPSDANFVDIIHTCSGVLGVEEPIGHADFYPNNGKAPQPGCQSMQSMLEACSHSRSHYYFTESILFPGGFPAHNCKNWSDYLNGRCYQLNFMGEGADRNVKGIFYLDTNEGMPFGKSFIRTAK